MNQATGVGAALNVAHDDPPNPTLRQHFAQLVEEQHRYLAAIEVQKARAEKLGLLDIQMADFRQMIYPGYASAS